MNLLFQALMWIGSFFLSSFLKRILAGAGIGIISFVAQQMIYTQFLNYLQSHFNILSALTIIMFDLSGLSIALSLVVSSVGIRMTLNSGKLAFRKI
ncbi:DUF2523 family protein [Acinetobacter haemolyticus]|uniref:DUF2523 family protein n=1 Tax=Acinetobacter haemolyticus TaxID=29430 RepID=UPI0021CDAB7E|nr:DUF2523 family protein [Acinetobacter haemolyticus]MCU4377945.1 DUF2523 domain-containing protein [Acinetobacter haemolyticus]